jgi:hypothetical protein
VWCDPHRMGKGTARSSISDRVATPYGFVAEIVSVREECARIRYLGPHHGPEELDLPLSLLRPATARDLILTGLKQ